MKPIRIQLDQFPDVVIHAEERGVKKHPDYASAKSGDISAAERLVEALVNDIAVSQLVDLVAGHDVELVPIHALESHGINEIPAALAALLGDRLGVSVNDTIVQINTVGHTGANGFHRLANQALFAGNVVTGRYYLVVDDFVGQGGTLANVIGFISAQGGKVLGATVLTGKDYSAKLSPCKSVIHALNEKHGHELGQWWQDTFGFSFDHLTQSEARYLERTADANKIRDSIAAARPEGVAQSSSDALG